MTVRFIAVSLSATFLFGIALRGEPGESGPKLDLKDSKSEVLKSDAAPSTGEGNEPSSADPQLVATVRKLLKQLEAGELSRRDAAEAELGKLGSAALSLLPADETILNSGVRQAIARVRAKLEQALADSSSTAAEVTLDGAHTVKEIYAELSRQTGNAFNGVERLPAELLNHKLDVDWDGTPFWKALDEVLDQTQSTVYPFADGGGLLIRAKPNRQLPRTERAGYAGPLRLEVNRISLERDPRLAEGPRMRVGLEISWESRLNPISIEVPLAKIKAIDDQNKTLDSLRTDGTATSLISDGAKGTEVEVQLEGPARTAIALDSLKGQVRMLLPGRVEKFEFADLKEITKPDQRREKKIAQATVSIERIVRNNDLWEVQLKIRYDKAFEAFDSYLSGWILRYSPQLIDAEGKVRDNDGYDTNLRNDKEYGISYYYDIEKIDGAKFIYPCPVVLQRMELDYEIKEIRLP